MQREQAGSPEAAKGPYLIEAIARACDILRTLGEASEALRLSHIAHLAEVNKATAYRILFTLEHGGLIERTQERAYRLTFRSPGKGRVKLAYIAPSRSTPFFDAVCESIQRAAFGAEIDLVMLSPKKGDSHALQTAELFVREKVDLTLLIGIDPKWGNLLANRLHEVEIPVIGVETPLSSGTYYGADNHRAGFLAGRYLAQWAMQQWEGRTSAVLLMAASDSGMQMKARLAGISCAIRQSLPALSGSQILTLNSDGRITRSQAVIRNYLRTSRAQRVLIGAADDAIAIGAARAFEEAGQGECCAVMGQGASLDACLEMRNHASRLIGSVAYYPENYGDAVIRIATAVLRQRTVPRALFTKHQLITPGNLDRLYPAYGGMPAEADFGAQMQMPHAL